MSHVLTPPRTTRAALLLGLGVGFVLLALLVGGLLVRDDVAPAAEAAVAHDADTEAAVVAAAHTAIEAEVNEADQFVWGKSRVVWLGQDAAVCGEVNIVETQDSFEGPETYVFAGGQLTLESVDGSDAVDRRWKDVCDT